MESRYKRLSAGVLALAVFGMGAVWAEVNVSLTITGDLNEILAIVQHLKQMGFGPGDVAASDPMKLEIYSVQAMGDQPIETPAAPPADSEPVPVAAPPAESEPVPVAAPPAPVLALQEAAAVPPNPSPGAPVLITVKVVDKEGRIDTVAAALMNTEITVDLKDDGMNGDAAAGDGIWSGNLGTPADANGAYVVQITAFDANGGPLMALNAEQIMANVSVTAGISIAP